MTIKTTQRVLRDLIANGSVIDVTGWSTKDLGDLKRGATCRALFAEV